MRITDEWLKDKGLQQVLYLLTDAGHQAFLVGGCVRNALLGEPVADVDIASDAVPERVTALARAAGLKVVPTGIDHGTVTIVVAGVPHEVTTFRRDVETFGRHATIAYAAHIEEDAARRDFTMNALYADSSGRVVDPLGGGMADLRARRVRFVGDADARIREDYLRILRFFRFHAWYGDPASGMDATALAACAANIDGLGALSRERIGHEMRRLLAAPNPAPALAGMQAAGALARILPGADAQALGPLVHLEPPYAPDWIRRLAALGAEDAGDALRLSRDEVRRLSLVREGAEFDNGTAAIAYRHGAEIARDVVLLRGALIGSALPSGWEKAVAAGASARFPLRAADLMPGLSGAALGRRLSELEARWIASDFELSREQLLA